MHTPPSCIAASAKKRIVKKCRVLQREDKLDICAECRLLVCKNNEIKKESYYFFLFILIFFILFAMSEPDNATLKRLLARESATEAKLGKPNGGASLSAGQYWAYGFNAFSLAALAAACLTVFVVIFLVTRSGATNHAGFVLPGNNCSVITCPAGVQGPIGVQGKTYFFVL